MIGVVYSDRDPAGKNAAVYLIDKYDFRQVEAPKYTVYENDYARLYEIDSLPFEADFVDAFRCDVVFFLSRHKSEAGVGAFTTHSLGNWGKEAKFGGKPKRLSCAAPVAMLSVLSNLNKTDASIAKTYEATHHGPLLSTPSLFVELGGNDEAIGNKDFAAKLGEAVYDAAIRFRNEDVEYEKVVLGIGSNHYPEKFSRLALERGYAFSHIMPKYAMVNGDGSANFDVLAQTMERSTHKPEAAVMDWKSLNSVMREEAIRELGKMGLDYEKV